VQSKELGDAETVAFWGFLSNWAAAGVGLALPGGDGGQPGEQPTSAPRRRLLVAGHPEGAGLTAEARSGVPGGG